LDGQRRSGGRRHFGWDGEHQVFEVTGHYDMSVEYDQLGSHMQTKGSTRLYSAKLDATLLSQARLGRQRLPA